MAIIVTGTPGTGKTFLAHLLVEETGYRYLDLTTYARANGFVVGTDHVRGSLIVDHEKLMEKLADELAHDPFVVVDGHFSQELPPYVVEVCIVTKTELPELKKRLEARGYPPAKVRENLDAEIFDTCRIEALEHGHRVETIWT